MNLEEWLFATFLALLVGSFVATLTIILRFAMGVSWTFEGDPGQPLRKSWWGDAGVNSVSCRGIAQVVEYRDGWLIRVLPTFIFGVLWLPKDKTEIGPLQPGGWFFPPRRILDCGSDSVVLLGHLADFISDTNEVTIEGTVGQRN
jgi:hypothetical protein